MRLVFASLLEITQSARRLPHLWYAARAVNYLPRAIEIVNWWLS